MPQVRLNIHKITGGVNTPSVSLSWSKINTATNASPNCGYVVEPTDLVVPITLPANAVLGDRIVVIGDGAWQINQRVGQQIKIGDQLTTVGTDGYLLSTESGDYLELTYQGSGIWYGTKPLNTHLLGIPTLDLSETGIIAIASEDLLAGSLVNIYMDGFTLKVRNAIASSGFDLQAHGYVRKAYALNANAKIWQKRNTVVPIDDLQPWTNYYLSPTTPGGVTSVAPVSGSNHILQYVGKGFEGGLLFDIREPILRNSI